MARKYSRDNRGRFASSGTGATARGGRLKTAGGNKRATQTRQMPAAPRAGTVGKGGSARGSKVAKTAASIQSPVARKDRVDLAAERKSYAGKLRSLPKEARKAIQIEKISRDKNMGNQAKPMANIAEGRMRLINNAGKRKNKLSPGEVDSIAKSMSGSARKLKAGMAMGSRGRARYNPNAVTPTGQGSAARKIQGAKSGGTVAKPKGLKRGAVTARVKAKAVSAKPAATTRPTINRTRKQAAAAQLDRKRQTLENTKAIRGKQSLIAPEGISRRSVKVNQRNMLTGGVDRVTTKVQTKVQGERVSPLSSFGRKNTARSERASNRLDALIQARRNIPKPRKATERAA